MQSWRHSAAQMSSSRLAADCHSNYIMPIADTQVNGHVRVTRERTSAAVKCSYLSAALDAHMLQRAMQCAEGLSQVRKFLQTHITPMTDTQVHGHLSIFAGHPSTAEKFSYLSAALDAHMLQRAMMCAVGLMKVCS